MASEFWGYRRPDGRIGVRNKILILPASVCATDTARIVAGQVEGAVTFHNQNGCSQVPSDMKLTLDTLAGMAANPNIYGTVVISLGCEGCQMDLVVEEIRKRTNKPLEQFVIQENGGTITTAERAVRAAKRMAQAASMEQRVKAPISELIVGTECGGSDQTSGLASNPLIGNACDRLVDMGATAVLSETTEFIGAEHILARRGRTPEVSRRIYEIVHRYACSLACSADGHKLPCGSCYVNPLLANTSKQNVTRYIYEIARLSHDIAGGILATMPSEKDFNDPTLGPLVQKYLKGVDGVPVEDRYRMLRLLENMTGGTALVESMHGAGSPQAQRVMLTRQANLEMKKKLARRLAGVEEKKES